MHVETNPKHYPNRAFASKKELIGKFLKQHAKYVIQYSHIIPTMCFAAEYYF